MEALCNDEKTQAGTEQDEAVDKGPPKWRSTRFVLAYMVSLGMVVTFYQRVSFSMVIVCMVNHTALDLDRQEVDIQNTGRSIHLEQTATGDSPQLRLLGLFGDATSRRLCHTQIWRTSSGGDQRGGHVGVVYSLSSASLLSPWALFIMRVLAGLCTALVIPGLYSIWGRWAPVGEKTQLLGMSFAGQMIANSSAFPFTALLCQDGPWGGWPSVFYIFGGLGILWSMMWAALVRDAPELHPRIDPREKDHILSTRAALSPQQEKLKVPWRQILSSWCFWAIAVAQFTYNWGFFLLITNLPIFMYEVMHFDIKSNGVFSMLPYICLFIVMSGAGFLSDFVIKRRFVSVLGARKLYIAVAYIIPAILLILMSYVPCTEVAAVMVLLVIAVGLTGLACTGGFFINPYDIAPRYASNIYTATNTMATMSGVINPYVVAAVTKDKTREQWQIVFYITAVIFLVGTIFFCIFAKAEVQPWAKPLEIEIELKAGEEKSSACQNLHEEN